MNSKPLMWAVVGALVACVWLAVSSAIFVVLADLPLNAMRPTTALAVYWHYGDQAVVPGLFWQAHALGLAVCAIGAACLYRPARQSLHGDARWARLSDLKKSEPSLLAASGIFLGRFKRRFLVLGGQGSVLVAAPTRAGKGVSVVVPNCLAWPGSLLVVDIKRENFELTAGYRSRCGQAVYLFTPAPTDRRSHRWNPFDYVSRDEHQRITDLQRIATLLIPEGREPMWSSDARELFVGMALLIMENSDTLPFTLGEMYRQFRPGQGDAAYFKSILSGTAGLTCTQPASRQALSKMATMADKQRSGVLSSLTPTLNLFANPVLDAAMSASDVDFRTLRHTPQTIYLALTHEELETYRPIVRLFCQQLVDQNTRSLPDETEPHQLLLLLDEFAAMGAMPSLVHAIAFMAGFNVRMLAIVQSTAQLFDLYQRGAQAFLDNFAVRVFFAAKNHKSAQDIANELGDVTARSESISRNRGLGWRPGNRTQAEAKRHLMLPQDIKAVRPDKMLIFAEPTPPILADKVVYFRSKEFLSRCVPKASRRAARRAKTQSAFTQLVHPTPSIPELVVVHYPVRGEIALEGPPPLPPGGSEFSAQEVDTLTGELFDWLKAA